MNNHITNHLDNQIHEFKVSKRLADQLVDDQNFESKVANSMADQFVDDHIMDLMEDTTSSFCGNYNLGEFPPLFLLVCLLWNMATIYHGGVEE